VSVAVDRVIRYESPTALCKQGRYDEAFKLYKTRPDNFGATSLIAGSWRNGLGLDFAFQIFNIALNSGHTPDSYVLNALITACRKCGQSSKAIPLLDMNVKLNSMCIFLFKSVCVETGDVVATRKLLNKIKKREIMPDVKPTVVDFTQMIQIFSERGYVEDAFAVLDVMKQFFVQPNDVTYICLLKQCTRPELLYRGKEIHSQILAAKMPWTTSLGTALLNMYGKCGSISDASKVFAVMQDQKLKLDAKTWTALITAYTKQNNIHEALIVLTQMQSEGVTPDKFTYTTLMR
jgi:pentatricopeptide repeat protein